ncbi:CCHC-type domain-containing protein [Mycena sanguinolenta]|uniref:CCHC-type domain-containing protein n=1 Tax=Mycena sanguinolenta TaxID=230812 RepID=A0A8H6YGM9_9AGAR|nr:CCHC-type domain-containing protein [Mycena sanguinolenta]
MHLHTCTFDPRPHYPLLLSVARYWDPSSPHLNDPTATTLIFTHATGFHKEQFEPTVQDLYNLVPVDGPKIREVWPCDPDTSQYVLEWQEYSRAIHALLAGLGTGIDVDFTKRRLVLIGHSMGAIVNVVALSYRPELEPQFLIMVDIMGLTTEAAPLIQSSLIRGSTNRRDIWPSRAEVYRLLKTRPFWRMWDDRVLRIFVRTHQRRAAYLTKKTAEEFLDVAGNTEDTLQDYDSLDELPTGGESLFDQEFTFEYDSDESFNLRVLLRPVTPEFTSIMAQANPGAPAGTGVASFKVPRPWETNVPKFVTEDKDDLRDFMEQVEDIITLGQITDDDEKKRLLTSYLPARKREIIRPERRTLDFKKAVLKAYPEVKEDLDGTLEELERLCRENKGIKRAEEGRLKRFGMRFSALVRKLRQPPAIILNKEACKRYLDTLDRGFAETLRMAINTRNLIKEDLPQAAANVPPPAGTVDYRKEDPIQLEELVKMAERLANKGTESTWDEPDEVEIKRSDKFPIIKVERRDERLEEINGEISSLRDALAVSQRQAKWRNAKSI